MTSWSLTGQKVLDPSFSWRRIPYTLRVSLAATFLIGVAAHFFCYTNVMFNHDGAAMYWERLTFAEGALGSRWLVPVWQAMVACVQMPWLEGILTLLFYAVSAWLVCETLHIRYTALIVLVNGILVTSPTAISSNMYLSSAHQYAGALLFACLAVYLFERYRRGWLGAHGFTVYLADTRAERYYFDEPFGRKTALVMGSERYGISREWYEGDFRMIAIPMEGSCDSLNVGVAATVLAYEAVRKNKFVRRYRAR